MTVQYLITVIYLGLENLVISAAFNGWTFLTPILTDEGYFSTLCDEHGKEMGVLGFDAHDAIRLPSTLLANSSNSSSDLPSSKTASYPTCISQTEIFNLIFTLTTVVQKLAAFTGGIIFQRFGTWVTRILACFICAGGQLFLGFSSVNRPELLFPGMLCLSASGSLFYMVNMQAGNLFPKARSTIISTLVGLFLSGSVVFWVVSFVHDMGVPLSTIFYFLASLAVVSLFATFFFTSRQYFPHPIPQNFRYGVVDFKKHKKANENPEALKASNNANGGSLAVEEKPASFFTLIRETFFWTNAMQLIIMNLRNEFFQGTFDTWAESVVDGEAELDKLTNVFGIILLCGGIAAPLTGIVVDALKQNFQKAMKNEKLVELKALCVSSALLTAISVFFSAMQCIPNLTASYVSLPLYVLFRVSIYSNCSIAIASYFPSKYFGTLYGATLILAGVVSLLRYPLLSLVLRTFNGSFIEINAILLATCFLSIVHPIHLWRLYKHKAGKETIDSDLSSVCKTVRGSVNASFENDA